MEKTEGLTPVVIITRSFPPSPLTASSRALSFAENLKRFGYWPIVVTRNWDGEFMGFENVYKPSGTELRRERHENYEVYYVNFKGRHLNRLKPNASRLSRKIAALFDIYFGWHYLFDPYVDLLKFTNQFLKINKMVSHVIISVPPFTLLSFVQYLKKRHRVKVVVDYRDEWNTAGNVIEEENQDGNRLARRVLDVFNGKEAKRRRELMALSYTDALLSVSEEGNKNLSAVFKGPITTLPNGFIEQEIKASENVDIDQAIMQISYAGWLYKTQQIEPLLDSVKQLADKYGASFRMRLLFIGGLSFPDMKERLMELMKGFEKYIELTPRVTRAASLEMQRRSALLMLIAHKGQGAIPSSKLYEYIALERQVLLVPSDNGIMQRTLQDNNIGLWTNDPADLTDLLEELYLSFIVGKLERFHVKGSLRNTYERGELVSLLAETLQKI